MAVLATFQHPQTPTDDTGLIQPLPFNTPDSPGLYCENSDEIVASSQPFEDGEYDLLASQGPAPLVAPSSTALAATPSTPLARRARLVRRASPIKPQAIPADTHHTAPRPAKLVRRVTFTAELERRRRRARIEARRIFKKLQALATTVHHLKRKHRELRMLGAGTLSHNKENQFSALF